MTRKRKKKRLSEDDALDFVLKEHPQWRSQWHNGTLPEEILGEDGEPMNPRLHITMHTVVERQLAADNPKGVVAIAEELRKLGLSRHDVRHEIARALAEQIWHTTHEGVPFNEQQYFAELRKIVKSHEEGREGFVDY